MRYPRHEHTYDYKDKYYDFHPVNENQMEGKRTHPDGKHA